MKCDEFEAMLQRQADGIAVDSEDRTITRHRMDCPSCRELEQGFRLLAQGFMTSRLPDPPADLADRIVETVLCGSSRSHRLFGSGLGWVLAAGLLLSLGLWGIKFRPEKVDLVTPAPAPVLVPVAESEPLLFPDLGASGESDPRETMALVEAVEPVSEIFRAVGRSLQVPVRPIAAATSSAVGELLSSLPDAEMPPMPGRGEMMPPTMKRKMGSSDPSS